MSQKILFVDDEPQILKALKRSFIDTEFTILLANSGEEALEILETETVDMVISDMRMPYMDGYELLRRIKEKNENIIRIMLSGYTDEKIVYKALLNNLAKSYLFKPWNNAELIQMIQHIFKVKEILNEPKLNELVVHQEDLPTPKDTYHKLNLLIAKDASSEEIGHVIEADQSVCSKVLRISNSAFYGIKTTSIKQAITYIGLNNVKDIVLSCSIFENLKLPHELHEYRDMLWQHSSTTSYYLSAIYLKLLNSKVPPEAFAVGILHDIGKVVILQNFPEVALKTFQSIKQGNFHEGTAIELEMLGFTHETLGGLLLEWWDFPFSLVESAMYHHHPENTSSLNRTLINALFIADQYALKKHGYLNDIQIPITVLEQLGLSLDVVEHFMSPLTHQTVSFD